MRDRIKTKVFDKKMKENNKETGKDKLKGSTPFNQDQIKINMVVAKNRFSRTVLVSQHLTSQQPNPQTIKLSGIPKLKEMQPDLMGNKRMN